MENIRSALIAAVGLVAVVVMTVFAASVGFALIGVLAVLTGVRIIVSKFNPAPVPVKTQNGRDQTDMRVWDDGRGKIIDL